MAGAHTPETFLGLEPAGRCPLACPKVPKKGTTADGPAEHWSFMSFFVILNISTINFGLSMIPNPQHPKGLQMLGAVSRHE